MFGGGGAVDGEGQRSLGVPVGEGGIVGVGPEGTGGWGGFSDLPLPRAGSFGYEESS